MTHAIEPRIKGWLTSLADATVPGNEPVTPDRIATVALLLAKDSFPAAAYTSDSLHHVAGASRFFPSYAECRDALTGWWEAHRPRMSPALPGPHAEHLEPMDRAWLSRWHQRRAEILADGYEPQRGDVDADLANLASLVQDRSPKAWAVIRGPEVMPRRGAPTPEEVAAVARSIGRIVARREPEPEGTPSRDVSLKGEALQRTRDARFGIVRPTEPMTDREPGVHGW